MAEPGDTWLHWWRARRDRTRRFQDQALPIVSALRDGDLKPLARYLEAGGLQDSPPGTVAVPRWLAEEIADMIDEAPTAFFHIFAKGRKPGEKGWTEALRRDDRDWRVGYFVERRQREIGRGGYDAAIRDAIDEFKDFKLTEGTARRLHSKVKRYLDRAKAIGVDGWTVLSDHYSND
jgi:hypothetical protein